MYKAKEVSKRAENSRYKAYIKKEDPLDKTNYRPISILPIVSKIFERILSNQLQLFSNKFLSPRLCGFRKGYSSRIVGIFLMDLPKAYYCVNHDLVIAKLEAYGVGENSLRSYKIIFPKNNNG